MPGGVEGQRREPLPNRLESIANPSFKPRSGEIITLFICQFQFVYACICHENRDLVVNFPFKTVKNF